MNPIPMLLSFSVLALLVMPRIASADGQFYGKLFGGASALSSDTLTFGDASGPIDFETGYLVGGAIGYDYANSPFRTEVEFTYRTGDTDTIPASIGTGGDLASTSLMINAYYDFETGSAWTPYVGIGIGAATEIDYDVTGAGEFSDTGLFAAQIMAGASYAVNEQTSVYGELRYFDAGSVELSGAGGVLNTDYSSVDLAFGVSFTF